MTRIVVLLKDIVDLTELKVDPLTREPRTEGIKRKISELDKRALEAAIQLKEKSGGEVLVLSMGGKKTRTALLEAMAIGADSAYIINDERLFGVDALSTSKILKNAIDKIGDFDLVMSGEMTLDSMSAQVGPRLAELLDLPQVTYVKKLEVTNGSIRAVRDLEDVDEVVEVKLPAVVSVVREITEARIPSLMNIMRAKKKPTEEWDAATLELSVEEMQSNSSIEVIKVKAPKVERKRIIIEAETIEETVEKLANAIIAEGFLEL